MNTIHTKIEQKKHVLYQHARSLIHVFILCTSIFTSTLLVPTQLACAENKTVIQTRSQKPSISTQLKRLSYVLLNNSTLLGSVALFGIKKTAHISCVGFCRSLAISAGLHTILRSLDTCINIRKPVDIPNIFKNISATPNSGENFAKIHLRPTAALAYKAGVVALNLGIAYWMFTSGINLADKISNAASFTA